MKGILLVGGRGSRLRPVTWAISKQTIPVAGIPMAFYPLSIQMLSGIRDVQIISTPADITCYENLFRDGSQLGMNFSYVIQPEPKGIAEAFLLKPEYIDQPVFLTLGDNVLYGATLTGTMCQAASEVSAGGRIFAHRVHDPHRFGVVEFDAEGNVLSLEEKPKQPKSHFAVPGLYMYGPEVVEVAASQKPSARGEREITDVNLEYLRRGQLVVTKLPEGLTWFDTGTQEAIDEASGSLRTICHSTGKMIACIEQIAFDNGWIELDQVEKAAREMEGSSYAKYLNEFIEDVKKGVS